MIKEKLKYNISCCSNASKHHQFKMPLKTHRSKYLTYKLSKAIFESSNEIMFISNLNTSITVHVRLIKQIIITIILPTKKEEKE